MWSIVRRFVLSTVACAIAPVAQAGEINIYYSNLKGVLDLTTDQNGNSVGGPSCRANTCTMFLDHQFAGDFPAEYLVAGIEWVPSATAGKSPPIFTDIVEYSAINYVEPGASCDPENKDPSFCADITITFYAAPFMDLLDRPIFQQPLADGKQHELTSYFEDPNLLVGIVKGLPPAAIHIFVTSDGARLPEPVAAWTMALGLVSIAAARACRSVSRR
ncbi:MAG: hypothetical protein SFV18_21350 [Bryobacteraceae bacterium]|nr:hypothetical protein [Bryobacteraceae bacterium]